MIVHYIKDPSGILVKIDDNSGGYPYLSRETIPSFWVDKAYAEKLLERYINMKLLKPSFFVHTINL